MTRREIKKRKSCFYFPLGFEEKTFFAKDEVFTSKLEQNPQSKDLMSSLMRFSLKLFSGEE